MVSTQRQILTMYELHDPAKKLQQTTKWSIQVILTIFTPPPSGDEDVYICYGQISKITHFNR